MFRFSNAIFYVIQLNIINKRILDTINSDIGRVTELTQWNSEAAGKKKMDRFVQRYRE